MSGMGDVHTVPCHYTSADDRLDQTIRRYLAPDDVVLDAGAGRGTAFPYDYARWVRRVIGVDVEETVFENPNVSEAYVADLARLPFPDAYFDLIFSRCVLEHLEDPVAVLAECRRVLRSGGHLIFRVPNLFHPYAFIAKLTPFRFHRWLNARRDSRVRDIFPTFYKANNRFTLQRLARATQFVVRDLEFVEVEPKQVFVHPLAHRARVAYAKVVQRHDRLRGFRSNIIGTFEAV